MGRSPSIQELAQKEKEFSDYLNNLEEQLRTRAKQYKDEMNATINKFYTDSNWSSTSYIGCDEKIDFVHSSEWSMEKVKEVINAIAKVIVGGSSKPPEGITITPPEKMGSGIAAMADLKQYVVGQAFNAIDNILSSFGSSTSTGFNSASKYLPVGNGLHLFLTVVSDSYQTQNFFNNEFIHQYIYIFQVKYSAEEAILQGNLQLTDLYENQIATFTKISKDILDQLSSGKITPEEYKSKTDSYLELIADSKKSLADLQMKQKKAEAMHQFAQYRSLKVKATKINDEEDQLRTTLRKIAELASSI